MSTPSADRISASASSANGAGPSAASTSVPSGTAATQQPPPHVAKDGSPRPFSIRHEVQKIGKKVFGPLWEHRLIGSLIGIAAVIWLIGPDAAGTLRDVIPVGFTIEESDRPGLAFYARVVQDSGEGGRGEGSNHKAASVVAIDASSSSVVSGADDDATSRNNKKRKSSGPPLRRRRHKLVIIPGFVSTQLETWHNLPCGATNVSTNLRQRITSPAMLFKLLQDPKCFLDHVALDPKTGGDLAHGAIVRPDKGLDAADYLLPSFWVWAKLIRNLADIGYDTNDMHMAGFDWRLSPEDGERRDGYFTETMAMIEHLVARSEYENALSPASSSSSSATNAFGWRGVEAGDADILKWLMEQRRGPSVPRPRRRLRQDKVIILTHSYGALHATKLLAFADRLQPGWSDDHVAGVVFIGGAMLGLVKAQAALLSGEVRDTAMLPSVFKLMVDGHVERAHRMRVFRTWSSLVSLLPRGPPEWWAERPRRVHAPSLAKPTEASAMAATSAAPGLGNQSMVTLRFGPRARVARNKSYELNLREARSLLRQDALRTGHTRLARLLEESDASYSDSEETGASAPVRTKDVKDWDGDVPQLPDAPNLRLYCFYGVGAPTEVGFDYYHAGPRGAAAAEENDINESSGWNANDAESSEVASVVNSACGGNHSVDDFVIDTVTESASSFTDEAIESLRTMSAAASSAVAARYDAVSAFVKETTSAVTNSFAQATASTGTAPLSDDAALTSPMVEVVGDRVDGSLRSRLSRGNDDDVLACPYASETALGATKPRRIFRGTQRKRHVSGVALGEGDGTVPLVSLGYLCRSRHPRHGYLARALPNSGATRRLGAVVTREYLHEPEPAYLDPRGGRKTGDHVDILGNYELLRDVLEVVTGGDDEQQQQQGEEPNGQHDGTGSSDGRGVDSRILSHVDELAAKLDAL